MEERRRVPSLTKADIEDAVKAAFIEHHTSADHVFLAGWMAREKRKQELWDGIKLHVGKWGSVAVIGYLFVVFGDGLRDTVKLWLSR